MDGRRLEPEIHGGLLMGQENVEARGRRHRHRVSLQGRIQRGPIAEDRGSGKEMHAYGRLSELSASTRSSTPRVVGTSNVGVRLRTPGKLAPLKP